MNVSSIAATCPIPCGASYSATKALVSFFTMALQGEVKNTDVMLLTPGHVRTPMIGNFKPLMSCTADECAQAALSDLSQLGVSAGTFGATLTKMTMGLCARNLPSKIWNGILYYTAAK